MAIIARLSIAFGMLSRPALSGRGLGLISCMAAETHVESSRFAHRLRADIIAAATSDASSALRCWPAMGALELARDIIAP